MLDWLKRRARILKREIYTLYLAARDPRTPWYARLLAAAVVAYALSPVDLIPDFVPVLGHLDDLIIVPAGLALVLRLVPGDVLADCRERAGLQTARSASRAGVAIIVGLWLIAAACVFLLARYLWPGGE